MVAHGNTNIGSSVGVQTLTYGEGERVGALEMPHLDRPLWLQRGQGEPEVVVGQRWGADGQGLACGGQNGCRSLCRGGSRVPTGRWCLSSCERSSTAQKDSKTTLVTLSV